jgi:cellulose biosynthesis protein BcsQ
MPVAALTGFTPAVGRSTMTAELAKAYAGRGRRVLAVDADGAGALARLLAAKPPAAGAAGLADAVAGGLDPLPLVAATPVPHLSLLPAGAGLGRIDDAFFDRMDDLDGAARQVVAALRPAFDLILVDTPADPTAPATLLALAAADVDQPLVPPGAYGRQPAPLEAQDWRFIQAEINPALKLARPIVVDKVPGVPPARSRAVAEAIAALDRYFGFD